MTLEEAILHLEEELKNPEHAWCCEECRKEHVQLEQWLSELQEYHNTIGSTEAAQRLSVAYRDYIYVIGVLWATFTDVPMNPETERIEAPFMQFPIGTHRERIWHWFDERYPGGVAALLYGGDDNETD